MRHTHYDTIVAWAEGKEIEFFDIDKWIPIGKPSWHEEIKYRIKPDPEPDVVLVYRANSNGEINRFIVSNLRLTFDGETGKLKKAEVIE